MMRLTRVCDEAQHFKSSQAGLHARLKVLPRPDAVPIRSRSFPASISTGEERE